MKKTYKKIVLAMLASVAVVGTASAQVIISDPLNSTTPVSLNGRTPAQDGGVGTTAWSAPSGSWLTNGAYNAAFNQPAQIAFNLAAAETANPGAYTLSANLALTPSSSTIILGFLESNAVIFTANFIGVRVDNGSTSYTLTNPGGSYVAASTAFTSGDLLSVKLTATSGTSGGTAAIYDNATLLGTQTFTAADEAGMTSVGLIAGLFGNGTGTVTNFQLTGPGAAPKPSTYALLLAGLAGLVFFARRRSVV